MVHLLPECTIFFLHIQLFGHIVWNNFINFNPTLVRIWGYSW
jgi:hypothetical protein